MLNCKVVLHYLTFSYIMVTITLYNYNGHNNVVNKTLTNGVDVTGNFLEPFNLFTTNVIFRFSNNNFNYNYCYIDGLNKYYFITDVKINKNNVYELTLKLDVLNTYSNLILSSVGTIVESENNKYLNTRSNIYDIRPKFEKLNFSVETPLTNEDTNNIIMITTKGNI